MRITTVGKVSKSKLNPVKKFIPNLRTRKLMFDTDGPYHFVYCIINLTNGKFYVGKHTSMTKPKGRSKYHGSNGHLRRAINKYSLENFVMLVLKYFETDALAYAYEAETITQKMVDSPLCYNNQGGGLGSSLGIKQTPEVLKKKSRNSRQRWLNKSEEEREIWRRRIGDGNRGKANPNKGKPRVFSEEHLRKMRTKKFRRRCSEVNKGRIITWGDKISKSKTKFHITEDQLLSFLKKNPHASCMDIQAVFGSRQILSRFGGMSALRNKLGIKLTKAMTKREGVRA